MAKRFQWTPYLDIVVGCLVLLVLILLRSMNPVGADEEVKALAERRRCGSIHWLFTTAAEQAELREHGFMARASFQYHWHNTGYASFDEFLARMTSRRRKQLRKERARVHASAPAIEWVAGSALTAEDIAAIDRFYRTTTQNHHGQDYLQPGFFAAVVAERVRLRPGLKTAEALTKFKSARRGPR